MVKCTHSAKTSMSLYFSAVVFREIKRLLVWLNSRGVTSSNLQIAKQLRLRVMHSYTWEAPSELRILCPALLFLDQTVSYVRREWWPEIWIDLEQEGIVGAGEGMTRLRTEASHMFGTEKKNVHKEKTAPPLGLYPCKLSLNSVFEMYIRIWTCVRKRKRTRSQWIT